MSDVSRSVIKILHCRYFSFLIFPLTATAFMENNFLIFFYQRDLLKQRQAKIKERFSARVILTTLSRENKFLNADIKIG